MSAPSKDELEKLRYEIDEIDGHIHDLILQRTAVVERIAKVKNTTAAPQVVLRPGREAQIIRRLLARHRGSFPRRSLVRIWRELIAGLCHVQGPFSLVILKCDEVARLTNLALGHFGFDTPVTIVPGVNELFHHVARTAGAIAIVSASGNYEGDPWWSYLAVDIANTDSRRKPLRVIGALPFVADLTSSPFPMAYVVTVANPEASGEDRSLLVADGVMVGSVPDLVESFRSEKIALAPSAQAPSRRFPGQGQILFTLDGFIADNDERLVRPRLSLTQGGSFHVLGAYANPIVEEA